MLLYSLRGALRTSSRSLLFTNCRVGKAQRAHQNNVKKMVGTSLCSLAHPTKTPGFLGVAKRETAWDEKYSVFRQNKRTFTTDTKALEKEQAYIKAEFEYHFAKLEKLYAAETKEFESKGLPPSQLQGTVKYILQQLKDKTRCSINTPLQMYWIRNDFFTAEEVEIYKMAGIEFPHKIYDALIATLFFRELLLGEKSSAHRIDLMQQAALCKCAPVDEYIAAKKQPAQHTATPAP